MDKETRPSNQNGGNGSANHHKKHRRKPFYIKKNNEGSPSDPKTGANGESAAAGASQAVERKETEKKPERQENAQKEQGGQGNSNQGHQGNNRNRRNRHRGGHGKDHKSENAGSASQEKVESLLIEEGDTKGGFFEENDSETPEVIVAIEDEIVEVEDDTPRVHVTGVRFKPGGKIYYFDHGELTIKNNDYVIVDTARGLEFGEVAFGDKQVKETALVLPLRQVVRVATKDDVERNAANKKMEAEAMVICQEKIAKHGLDMKLIEAQYSFDNSKLLFYFTSANRVDFRELVKDLAGVFRTRIELRQIGIRDEAKIMGGLGACGRPLCCATFLSDFVQVSIKMAKEQNLSLNSGKISGCCGRLMCCLQYEYKTYREEGAKTPSVGSTVRTRDGVGIVTDSNILAGVIKVRLNDKPDVPPASYKRDEVTVLNRAKVEDDD